MTTEEQLFAGLENDGIKIDANTVNKAKNGDDIAMKDIGDCYYHEKQRYDKSMAWYRLAADKYNSEAQNFVGFMYHHGLGVPKDYSLAMEWYLKAAIQNNKYACWNIGELFENGYGVPVDKYKALEWYYKQGEDSRSAKRLTKEGIRLKQQDKNKSIEQLAMDTEELAWPGIRLNNEKVILGEPEERIQKRLSRRFRDFFGF